MSMKGKTTKSHGMFDGFMWLAIVVLLAAGVVGNYYVELAVSIRIIAWLVLIAIVCGLALITHQGRAAWSFAQQARIEMRKVVWPTRQETIQTTIVVIGVVLLASLILWGVDSIFIHVIGWLTGQRG